jgi:hypothetical protein
MNRASPQSVSWAAGKIVFSTDPERIRKQVTGTVTLRGDEAMILQF